MWKIIVCDENEIEREQIVDYIRSYCGENNQEADVKVCSDWPGLMEQLRQEEPDVLVVTQNGVDGLDTITSAHLPPRKVVWFSDLDFGVQSYRLCLSWFGRKPVTYRKIRQALFRCMEENGRMAETDDSIQ